MSRDSNQKAAQNEQLINRLGFSPSLKKKYLTTIAILTALSLLNISLKSDKVNSNIWSFSIELKVTSVTLILVFLLWLPVLLPWFISLFPQLINSLNWLREQGIEEIETSLIRLKLSYGVQEASKNYEEKIWNVSSTASTSQETLQEIEKRYRDAIALVDTRSNIDSTEALKQIDQLADYYDRVRNEMPPGRDRTRLMREISSTMWVLVSKTQNFPVYSKLCSPKGGDRLAAYKYIEWQPSTEYFNLLLSRAVGVLEVPFNQYAALLTLRRVVSSNKLSSAQLKEITYVLNWSSTLIQVGEDRQKLMLEILSILEMSA